MYLLLLVKLLVTEYFKRGDNPRVLAEESPLLLAMKKSEAISGDEADGEIS